MADIDRNLDDNARQVSERTHVGRRAADAPVPEAVAALVDAFEGASVELRAYASSDVTYAAVDVPVEHWVAFVEAAKDAGFDTFIDIAAVDHYRDAPRYEVAVNLLDTAASERIVASTRVPYDAPAVPTLEG